VEEDSALVLFTHLIACQLLEAGMHLLLAFWKFSTSRMPEAEDYPKVHARCKQLTSSLKLAGNEMGEVNQCRVTACALLLLRNDSSRVVDDAASTSYCCSHQSPCACVTSHTSATAFEHTTQPLYIAPAACQPYGFKCRRL
jgi:hypothetical protein